MSSIFDASALISLLRDEPGADEVQSLLERESEAQYVHAINLCEVYYDFFRAAGAHSAESADANCLQSAFASEMTLTPIFGGKWDGSKRCSAVFGLQIVVLSPG